MHVSSGQNKRRNTARTTTKGVLGNLLGVYTTVLGQMIPLFQRSKSKSKNFTAM